MLCRCHLQFKQKLINISSKRAFCWDKSCGFFFFLFPWVWCPSHFCKKESLCSRGKLQENHPPPVIFHRFKSQTTQRGQTEMVLSPIPHPSPRLMAAAVVVCGGKGGGREYELCLKDRKEYKEQLQSAFIPSLVCYSLSPSTCSACSQCHCYFAFLFPVVIACGLCGFEWRLEEHPPCPPHRL